MRYLLLVIVFGLMTACTEEKPQANSMVQDYMDDMAILNFCSSYAIKLGNAEDEKNRKAYDESTKCIEKQQNEFKKDINYQALSKKLKGRVYFSADYSKCSPMPLYARPASEGLYEECAKAFRVVRHK